MEVTTLKAPLVIVHPVTGAKLFEFGINAYGGDPFFAGFYADTGDCWLEAGPMEKGLGSSLRVYNHAGRLAFSLDALEHGSYLGVVDPAGEGEGVERVSLKVAEGEGGLILMGDGHCAVKLGFGSE